MPPKKKGRKKEQPPLSVQGLLHLEASFVAPTDGVTLATVAPGSCYGYGEGAGHIPAEAETDPAAGPLPGPHGDSPVAAAGPPPPPADQPPTGIPNGEIPVPPPPLPPATLAQPPLPPSHPNGPGAHGQPEFAASGGAGDAAPPAAIVPNGHPTAVSGGAPHPPASQLAPQTGLLPPLAAAPVSEIPTPTATVGQAVIRAAPALLPPPPPPPLPPPLPEDLSGGGMDAASAVVSGELSTRQLVAAAAAAADPSGHWCSGAQHPQAAPAPAPAAAPAAVTAPPAEPHPESTAADGLLQHYWQFVRENQYDFNGWTYLLQHVEKQTNLDAIRAVYNAFLPLYPYCYAYWKKYAELEQRSGYADRARQILERAVRAIPLSVDLWMCLLNLVREMVKGQKTAQEQTRELCERAVRSAGSQFRSDALWECVIQWEASQSTLSGVTAIYRRLLKIPTRLYNRHWDNFLQHVRDYHPRDILERDEYMALRRQCCIDLDMAYREEPAFELPEPVKTPKPEVKLISAIKEKLVADMVAVHEQTEKRVEKRWKLEDKIKRPYFHVIPLDKRQLRAWREYLELEAADGDHHSLVQLYERCLISCAQYEEFWMQYARYLERQLPTAGGKDKPQTSAAAGSTGAPSAPPAAAAGAADDAAVQRLLTADQSGRAGAPSFETESQQLPEERSDVGAGFTPLEDPADAVREVYKRACLVHCPTKPNVRMQWAAFEESVGHAGTAVQLLGQVLASFPAAVRPWLQLIGLERRRNNLDECSRLYTEAAAAAPQELRTWWAMKHARFAFKILNKPDKALGILRTAVKNDRSNARLYLHILDVCYQRHPVDVRGVSAALTLALNSKDLSARDKLGFRRKRVEFFEEFGCLSQLRTAEEELESEERALLAAEKKLARQQEKEQERLEREQQEREQQEQEQREKEQAKAGAKRKSKGKMDPTPPPPLPEKKPENEAGELAPVTTVTTPCPNCGWNGSAGAAAAADQTAAAAPAAEPPAVYDQVPPTWDLTMSTQAYGYGNDPQYKWFQERGYREYSAREAGGYPASLLDPVSSDEESSQEPPQAKRRVLLPDPVVVGNQIVTRDGRRVPRYVIQPRAPTLRPMGRPGGQMAVEQPTDAPGQQEPQRRIPQLARLPTPLMQDSQCTNVPDWLVNEGGELLLSETENGPSRIRYWPNFMNRRGVMRMFQTLRRYVKWHQTRQVAADGRFVALKRLVAWFGPCGLDESGLKMPSNDSWSPELLDLLQSLCQFVGHEFNSCHLSLFRTGNDVHEWHVHDQPALGRHPTIAIISLGAIRCFELRQLGCERPRFLRFPLFPGSVLVMEGATQQDWQHQIPREAQVKEERIELQFRVMYDLKDAPGAGRPRLREPPM
ncbi:uncharacterized protein LOC122382017 [Amphibalanus amphitrite]|uniref:uncharacterized protein LOC122382017 n=1 Tax=Amphibalanus amphitrite TaxID=1232801 RepID=UPI001C901DD5|nr:uncharacterized protein LOC122382017 [Amphibalanus amphitrite]XP_043222818.1 uncharacterized protein LOC122382017 [Amphibalanus amphitrite]